MTYHLGRLLDHVHLRVTDLDVSRRFYQAALEALDLLPLYCEGDGWFQADELFVDTATGPRSNVHLAFQAQSKEQVERFHAMTIAAGGIDNGAPGLRPYHPTYFAAGVLDPDGNNVEAVYHGPTKRSCASIAVDERRPHSAAQALARGSAQRSPTGVSRRSGGGCRGGSCPAVWRHEV